MTTTGYDPVVQVRTRDGTTWVRFDHVPGPEWRKQAGHAPSGEVLLPAIAFEIPAGDIADELVRDPSIVFRRRNTVAYVSTDWIGAQFPETRDVLEVVEQAVRRAVSEALAGGYIRQCRRPVLGQGKA
jgi:hypothetical protein